MATKENPNVRAEGIPFMGLMPLLFSLTTAGGPGAMRIPHLVEMRCHRSGSKAIMPSNRYLMAWFTFNNRS